MVCDGSSRQTSVVRYATGHTAKATDNLAKNLAFYSLYSGGRRMTVFGYLLVTALALVIGDRIGAMPYWRTRHGPIGLANGKHPVKTAGQAACQFQGSRSSMRLAGWSWIRVRTSASQARASMSLSLQVSISV